MNLSKTEIQTSFQIDPHVSATTMLGDPAAWTMQSSPAKDGAEATRKNQERSITGVILAGGNSKRMGRNKALLDMGGITLIEKTYQTMAKLFAEVILITNTPDEYTFLNCRYQADIYPGIGSISGLHTALSTSYTDRIFIVPCDMPFLSPALISLICQTEKTYDAVVPFSRQGMEPLHALYHRRCLPQLEQAIVGGDKKITNFLQNIWTYFLPVSAYRHIPDTEYAFRNVNHPEDYEAISLPQQGNGQPEWQENTGYRSHTF